MSNINAPWTPEQVATLNAFQQNPTFHPYTCGSGNRTDSNHLDGEGILVATVEGWVCPFCWYRQDLSMLPIEMSQSISEESPA